MMERRYQEVIDALELLQTQPCTPRLWADMMLLWCQVVDSVSIDHQGGQTIVVLSRAQGILNTVWPNRPPTRDLEHAKVLISARSE